MEQFLAVLAKMMQAIESQSTIIAVVLGILFSVSKMVSNEKAPKIVAAIQKAFDFAAKAMNGLGLICEKVAGILADLIKSDGILGKK
jgi:hypothetical protein